MAYDEDLAQRVRTALERVADVREQRMFGGVTFLVGGQMACGVVGDELMLRLGGRGADAALDERHVRPMDFTGKPMRTMVFIQRDGIAARAPRERWIGRAVTYVESLPPRPDR
jgi:TfoX/Sxy family transcriptional regulator of competence genes